jgi:hypothetical protein
MPTRLALLTLAFLVATTARAPTTDFQPLARLFDYDTKQPLDHYDKPDLDREIIIQAVIDLRRGIDLTDFHKTQPARQLEKYCDVVGQVDAIHFVGHAAPIPLLL